MKIEIDARGKLCPKPVIMTKKELDKSLGGIVTTIVDSEIAKDNILKLAKSYGYNFVVDKSKDDYYISITKSEGIEAETTISEVMGPKDLTIAIGTDKMGVGEEILGKILMKSFIYTVRETKPLPSTIVLFNSGVYIACKGSEVLDDLKAMVNEGVELLVCGTCLDYYNIKDTIVIGEIANMYSIYEKMQEANKTINIG